MGGQEKEWMGCFLDDLRDFGGVNLYPPGVWFADAMASFSGVLLVLFCFVFVSMLSLKPRPFVQSSFDMQASR